MRNYVAAGALLFVTNASCLQAQLRLGDTLRVYQGAGISSSGRLASADSISLLLGSIPPADSVRILRSSIRSLERRRGSRPIGRIAVIAGIGLGTLGGLQFGAAVRESDVRNGGLRYPNFPYRGVGAVGGAVVGLIVGAIVGKVELARWETLPVDVRLSP